MPSKMGGGHWFVDRLRDNSLDDWTPRLPVHAFHDNKDLDVHPSDAVAMAERARRHGFSCTTVDAGDVDHDGSILAAAPGVLEWFDSLATR